jgi:PAS domain S-box-containing protein
MLLPCEHWLPRSLLGRIFALLTACITLFTVAGLGFIHNHHFSQEVGDANETMELLADVVLPTVSDSVVIGDYDTIQRTLSRLVSGSKIDSARFMDNKGTVVEASNSAIPSNSPPDWLTRQVTQRLADVNREINVGGTNYGTLDIRFSASSIAEDIWLLTRAYLLFALMMLVPGLYLARIPLTRMIAELSRVALFASQLKDHQGSELKLESSAIEVDFLAEALNQVSRELTTQHQALAESESRKSAILAAGLDCFITIDSAGHIIDFNRAAEQTFGYTADEVRGLPLGDVIIPPEWRQGHQKGMEHWHRTGEGPVLHQRIEITAMRRSGEIFPIELAVVPFGSGDRQYFAGFIRDISDRRALELERQALETVQRQMVSDLAAKQFAIDQHAIVSITDLDGTMIYANERLQTLSGYSAQELIGSNHRLLKSGLQDQSFYLNLWETIRDGRVWHGEYANRRKNGEIYWVAATIVPMRGDDDRTNQYISIQTDISEQKRTEHALAEARRREIETGSEIQRTLLLGDLPWGIHGAQLATYTEPSQGIDGDFFAITRFRPDCFEVLVGDVMGKGVPAALIGAGVKSSYNKVLAELFSMRSGERDLPAPADILNALHKNLTPRLIELDSFVTLALYRIDNTAGTLQFVNAGHTPGLLTRSNHRHAVEQLRGNNLPVGIIPEEIYSQHEVSVESGDALLIFSDGITETINANKAMFGIARLQDILHAGRANAVPPSSLLQSIRHQVRAFAGSDVLSDDQTALVIEITPQRGKQRGSLQNRTRPSLTILPWRLDQLGALRSEITRLAFNFNAEEIDALILASFEAATNILRHARPYFSDATIACRFQHDADSFSVELIYPGPMFTPPDEPQPDFSGKSDGGFGLYIIQQTVNEVTYRELLPGLSSIRLVKRTTNNSDSLTAA